MARPMLYVRCAAGVPQHCVVTGDCSPGHTCEGGACLRVEGACELDGDCEDASCVAGWCGIACVSRDECGLGRTCTLGRRGETCSTYFDCGLYEACIGGGCGGGRVKGGCAVVPSTPSRGLPGLVLLMMWLSVVWWRRSRR